MNLYISIDRKNKPETVIKKQLKEAKVKAEKEVGEELTVVDSVDKADCAWFVDEWEDDVECYKEHEYCHRNNVKILHDKSEFWNRMK